MRIEPLVGRLLPRLPYREARFGRRGFARPEPAVERHLEAVLEAFIEGFNSARRCDDDAELAQRLNRELDPHLVGFAFEGAGTERAARDLLVPWASSRLQRFVRGAAADHDYLAAVGAGLALSQLPWGRLLLRRTVTRIDPDLSWCVLDGLGFHRGMLRPRTYVESRAPHPRHLPASARRLFDAGLGRSLWWVCGASPEAIRGTIDSFPEARHADLWFGVGLAVAYAGGVDREALFRLRGVAGEGRPHLVSGIPFACRLRQKGGNPSPATDRAAEVLLGRDAEVAASWLTGLLGEIEADRGPDGHELSIRVYEELRARVASALGADSPERSARNEGADLRRVG